jgi:RNA polymerase sigma factor (sigma-70 family)
VGFEALIDCGLDVNPLWVLGQASNGKSEKRNPIKIASPLEKACQKSMKDIEVIHGYLETQASRCFSLLYERYAPKIFGKCISLLKDEELAQDATQEIFTKVFLNLSRFGEKSQFSTWVYSITYNYCIDFLRRKKKQKDIFSDEIEKVPDVAEEEVNDKVLLEMEFEQLKVVLDNIPTGDQAVLLMKYQDNMSIKDIAETLDKTESAIKMKLKRAKAKAQQVREEIFGEQLV